MQWDKSAYMESQSAEYPNTGKVITTVDLPHSLY